MRVLVSLTARQANSFVRQRVTLPDVARVSITSAWATLFPVVLVSTSSLESATS